jgi:hypothetical protein
VEYKPGGNQAYSEPPVKISSTPPQNKNAPQDCEAFGAENEMRLINRKFCGLMVAKRPKNTIFAKKDV